MSKPNRYLQETQIAEHVKGRELQFARRAYSDKKRSGPIPAGSPMLIASGVFISAPVGEQAERVLVDPGLVVDGSRRVRAGFQDNWRPALQVVIAGLGP